MQGAITGARRGCSPRTARSSTVISPAEESAVPGPRPSPGSLGRLTVRPRTTGGRWRGSTVIGPQRPLQLELELVLLAIHLDLDLDPYVVGHTQSQRRTAQIQLHLVPARQRFGDHHQ